ncbi:MAG: 16S rRNA (adenine(1518)-N(6)/adenine(1519)-N(6))-dimethyltransferase RsmA [Patescibacteria group bacterium]
MRRLGQYFLKNKLVIGKIVSAIEPRRGEIIVEIGGGRGELTSPLSEKCKKIGCQTMVIEKDRRLAEKLKEGVGNILIDIIEGDALKIIPALAKSPELKAKSYKIVGNIPYYITGRLLRILGEIKNKPDACIFTVQKEVAERVAAAPPRMNRLAASVQLWAKPRILFQIPREDFLPTPGVDSAAIKLETKTGVSEERRKLISSAIKIIFSQPRKTIFNNIRGAIHPEDKEKLRESILRLGIRPQDRPGNLLMEEVEKISELLRDHSA